MYPLYCVIYESSNPPPPNLVRLCCNQIVSFCIIDLDHKNNGNNYDNKNHIYNFYNKILNKF